MAQTCSIEQTLERVRQARAERAKTEGAQANQVAGRQEQQPCKVIQLPLWPDPVRAVPNGFLRSALFGALARGRRKYLEQEVMASLEGVEIRYTGQRLDQGDLDTWEAILHAVRLQELGSECRISSYHLLKLMDKKDTGNNRKVLYNRITRLRANAVEIKQGKHSYIGGLLASAAKDEDTGEWVIELDRRLKSLYQADQFTHIQWAVRNRLSRHPLAQWLHGFYSSHAAPYPIKIETLHRLCGSETAQMWKFKQSLTKALEELKAACEANGEPFSYEIKGDLLVVSRNPTKTQRKHLTGKKQKKPEPKAYNPWNPY